MLPLTFTDKTPTASHSFRLKVGARESVWCPPEDTYPDSDWTMAGGTRAIARFYWFLKPTRVAHEVLRVQQFGCLEKAGGRAEGEEAVFAGVSPRASPERETQTAYQNPWAAHKPCGLTSGI